MIPSWLSLIPSQSVHISFPLSLQYLLPEPHTFFPQPCVKHHGLPQRVVSDRGPQFVAEFTRELYRLLGIKLAATTAYHPQGDGQTEWVNQELEQYLRLFTNQRQDDWVGLLPFTEFQYNNQVHSSLMRYSDHSTFT